MGPFTCMHIFTSSNINRLISRIWSIGHHNVAIPMWKYDLLWKITFNILFQQAIQTWGESEINYIKILHDYESLVTSVGNSYSRNQLIHTFFENFHWGVKCSAHIASHQEEMRREENLLIKNHYLYLPWNMITWICKIR